jgi:hypothetical protein
MLAVLNALEASMIKEGAEPYGSGGLVKKDGEEYDEAEGRFLLQLLTHCMYNFNVNF